MKTKQVKSTKGTPHWILSEGASSVKIYTSSQEKNGVTYVTHCVDYFEARTRVRKSFSKLDDAKAWGATVLARMANGEHSLKGVEPVELQEIALARQELAGLNVNLPTVAKEYRQATQQLNGKGTINDAVRYFLKNASPALPNKTVAAIVEELIAAKTKDGLSKIYLDDLRVRLARFARAFPGELSAVTTAQIEGWLRGLGTGAKNRNNFATSITTLFSFSKRAGYLSSDRATAAEGLTRAKDTGGNIEVYTPDELKTMLQRLRANKPELLPFVAIGAFAGVRVAELTRLAWEDIDFEQGLIEVGAKKSKTAQRRHVPIQPNLAKWLEPYRGNEGLIVTYVIPQQAVLKVVEAAITHSASGKIEKGVKWKPNALRHSYGSFVALPTPLP